MRTSPAPKVAIISTAPAPWVVPSLGAIRRYARAQGWHLSTTISMLYAKEDMALALDALKEWDGDALITLSNSEGELRQIQKLGIPAVNLAGSLPESLGVPRVLINDFHAGRMAAEHLLNRGLRHLAYLGREDLWYSEQRRLGFSECSTAAGVKCGQLLQPKFDTSKESWSERINEIARWITSLPRPTGIFAMDDYRAQLLMEACQEAGLRIPDDIAVVGMENDEAVCEHSVPTLTSIACNREQVGWEAAVLLDHMMQGKPPPATDLIVEPEGIVARQSTDLLHCAEPLVRRALVYMRSHMKTQSNIEQIAGHLGVSKRTLEKRFRENFPTSPHDFLTRLRVEHARALMQTPQKRTIEQLAHECGFGSVRAFYYGFERVMGQSLASFRKELMAKTRRRAQDGRPV